MIYVSRPAPETHKIVPKTDNHILDSDLRDRKPILVEERQEGRGGGEFNREGLEEAVEETNRMVFKDNNKFEFKVHERTGRMMVKLVDQDTKEVIKEIPPEKILDLVASIWDLVGILVDERG